MSKSLKEVFHYYIVECYKMIEYSPNEDCLFFSLCSLKFGFSVSELLPSRGKKENLDTELGLSWL